MSIAVLDERIPTFADVIARLGDIPPGRVLMQPLPGTAAEADLLRTESLDKICELLDGTLAKKALSTHKSILLSGLAGMLWDFVERHRPGILLNSKCPMRMLNGNVRRPDISFLSWDQFAETDNSGDHWCRGIDVADR